MTFLYVSNTLLLLGITILLWRLSETSMITYYLHEQALRHQAEIAQYQDTAKAYRSVVKDCPQCSAQLIERLTDKN